MDGDKQVAKGVFRTVLVLSGLIFGPMWYGYVLSILWLWFIVPTFGLPVLTKALAVGIGMTIKFITRQDIASDDKDLGTWKPIRRGLINIFFWPAFALLYGYIVKQFI